MMEGDISTITYNSQPTVIKKVISGDRCPVCGKSNSQAVLLRVVDRSGKTDFILGLLCQCGTKYLTKKLFNKLKHPKNFKFVTAQFNEVKKAQITGEKRARLRIPRIHFVEDDNEPSLSKCNECGADATVFNSGLCWNCYKNKQQSIFE